MSTYKTLKQAADKIEKLATALEKAEADLALAKTAAAQAEKVAEQAKQAKTASDAAQAKLGGLAKEAADKLLAAGLLSNAEKRDLFASQILNDHGSAISQISKLAAHVRAPKLGSVVVGTEHVAQTADQAWEARIAKHVR
jgi:hypothetical protein